MKILITGASGLLGYAFAQAAKRRKHYLVGITGSYSDRITTLDEQYSLDLSDSEKTEELILEQFPDAIVNCAAISQPSDCDKAPELSFAINTVLPETLAKLARHLFATFIHISSEQVFDGENAPYASTAPVSPLIRYAEQKAESEARVLSACGEFASILRAPLLNGNSLGGKRSLHEALMHSWANGQTTPLFDDERRQPCHADNLAQVMLELCERSDLKGLFNWGGADSLTRYEMGQALIKHFGLPENLIVRSHRGEDPRFAKRQKDLSLDLQPLAGKTKTAPQLFEDQLDSLIVPKPVRNWYNAL